MKDRICVRYIPKRLNVNSKMTGVLYIFTMQKGFSQHSFLFGWDDSHQETENSIYTVSIGEYDLFIKILKIDWLLFYD